MSKYLYCTNRYTKTLDSWNVKQGKIHTEKRLPRAKNSVRWRYVKNLKNYMASKSIYSIQKFSPNEAKP